MMGILKMKLLALLLSCLGLLVSCKPKQESLEYDLVASYPHDQSCYTQGLEFHDGRLFESAGQYGESELRQVDPRTGEVQRRRKLPAELFAEGLTVLDGELWLLTWREGQAFVFDPKTFELRRRYRYPGEGWGLTNDGKQLIMSDGSSFLTWRDPGDFSTVRTLEVTRDGRPQKELNELEYVDGAIYANIYTRDEVVRIDPKNGQVTGVLDLSELRNRLEGQEVLAEELNGIARDPATGRLWLTGKHWSRMYELKIKPRDSVTKP